MALCIRGECSGCRTGAQCTDQLGLPVCRADGLCVECDREGDCAVARPFCSAAGRCLECRDHDECEGARPFCDDAGECRSCRESDVTCSTEQLTAQLFAAFCRVYSLYDGEGSGMAVRAAENCSGRFDVAPILRAYREDILAGRRSVDPELLACYEETTDLFPIEACSDYHVAPAVAPGGLCHYDEQCLDGYCDTSSSCPGTCLARVAAGATCTTRGQCRAGLTCSGLVCQPLSGDGEPCGFGCLDGLFCAGGSCDAPRPEGAACTLDFHCERGLDCSSGVCSQLPAEGEACRPSPSPYCRAGLRCVAGTCRVPNDDGEPCSDTLECQRGSRCVEGTCSTILMPGAPCESSAHCALGLSCRDGRCLSAPDVGETCFAGDACLRGECNGSSCAARGEGAACEAVVGLLSDALDTCGSLASCLSGSCVAESGLGVACGPSLPPCRLPELYCIDGICDSICLP